MSSRAETAALAGGRAYTSLAAERPAMTESLLSAARRTPRETWVVVGAVSASQYLNHAYLVLFPPILAVLSGEFTVGLAALGVALGVQGATNTAFQLPFGRLADRHDRTLAFGLSSVLGAVGVLAAAAAPTYEWLLVAQAVIGVGVAGHHPAHYPLISDSTPDDLMGRAYSLYGFGGSVGFATPPVLIAGIVSAGYSWRIGVGIIGVVGLVAAVALTWLFAVRVDDAITAPNAAEGDPDAAGRVGPGERGSWVARTRAYLRELAAAPGVLALALLALVTSTSGWGFTSYIVVFLQDGYELSLSRANLALTGSYLVGAVAVFVGGDLSDRVSAGPVMIASFAAVAGLVAVLALGAVGPLAAVGLVLLVGGARSIAGPARSKLTDAFAPDGTTGTSFAITTIGVMLGNAVAPPAFGYLIETAGRRAAFLAVAGVSLLAVVLTVGLIARFGDT
ncbi:MFS transporter [Halobaculum magnesiiphilum]|uniref:MFS transporter n=1 Tax=Halobaculum magnesiiphilum TaxID=1017351 RepID=A0A8T8WGM6_9EURY|nr:MFS transporter [Halobaculum magnesiiphilum]QZP38903.1 MFS transporter [Halobaculum magnesiiphilum]